MSERQAVRNRLNREELGERIASALPQDGRIEPIQGLFLNRSRTVHGPILGVMHPSICMIAQGVKEIYLGEECHRYDPYHYLLSTVEMPVIARLVEASPEQPYLGLRLDLEPALIASVMLEAGILPSARRDPGSSRALETDALDDRLLECFVRLLRLLESSAAEQRVLMPLIVREIIFHLLHGGQSSRVRQMAISNGQIDPISRAIERLRANFDKNLRIENLAHEMGMSPSGFHSQFKAVTAMSPLQFQKQLRLQEARRLLLSEDVDAATAAYRVGYDSSSHFSREYKRLFGEPPLRDVQRLREAAEIGGAISSVAAAELGDP